MTQFGPPQQTMMVDAQRVLSASETLARIFPMMDDFGITRLANLTGLDCISLPVVAAIRPNARSIAISQGKGNTLDHAKVSALMEAIEIWHAEHLVCPVFFASVADLEERHEFIDLARLPVTPQGALPRTLRAHWIAAKDLMSDTEKLVPLEMVHADYTHPSPTDVGYFPASTNGLASGNHRLEAICHAICEVVERDALSVWHHLPVDAQKATQLDLDTVQDPGLRTTMQKFFDAGLELAVWDITTDMEVASFLCVALDRTVHGAHLGLGSGTHPNPVIALHRAFNEAAQTRLNYISGAREDLFFQEFSADGRRAKSAFFDDLLRGYKPQLGFDQDNGLRLSTLLVEVDWLKGQLGTAGIHEIAVVDLTRTEHAIPVVRVIIPGLEAPHDDATYVPGARALHAQDHMAIR